MKKKFIFLMLIFSILCIGGGKINSLNAQETPITVGSGDEYKEYMPLQTSGSYAISQQIYRYEEIGKTGTITSIALKVKFGQGYTRNISVYMANISIEEDVFPETSYTVSASLFDGELSLVDANDEWIEIELTTPFEYTGGNLLLCICDNTNKAENSRSSFYTYTTTEVTSFSVSRSSQYNPVLESYATKGMWSDNRKNYKNQIKFTFGASVPSVKIDPESIDLGTVRTDDNFFTEKPFDYSNYAVTVKAQGGAIIMTKTIEQEGDFFKIVDVYNIDGGYQYHISYNQNGTAGDKEGTLVVTYKDSESAEETNTATIPLSAVAYSSATKGEAIENPIEVAFTNNAFTDEATGMHDDYILPGEENDGNLKDAVYTFTLAKESLITASVNGTNPIVAIYNSDFGEKDGPSSDNNYEGIQPEPSAPTTFGPYTFTTDGTELTNNFVNSGWVHYAYGSGYIYTMTPSSYILTKTPFLITNDSKLTFTHKNVYGVASGVGYNVFISTDNVYGNADDIIVEECQVTAASEYKEVPLSGYAGKEYYIGFSYTNKTDDMLGIDDLALTDGSAESNSQIDGVPYPAGDYYLVAAAEGDFTLNLSISELTAPAAFALTAPEDNAREQNNPKLAWEAAKYALSYNVYIGTSSDLSDAELVEVTTNSYQTENLSNNTRYYWTVEAVNEQGTTPTTSGTWSFVTTLNKPTNVTASETNLYPGDETTITWTAAEGATNYNVYVGETKVASGVTSPYTLSGLDYNVDPGHNVTVTANHTLGESAKSDAVVVKMTGSNDITGTITNGAGATLTFTGTDEFGEPQTFTKVLDDDQYTINVLAGTYTVTASKFDYQDLSEELEVIYATTLTFYSEMTAFPEADASLLSNVAVTEVGENAQITWTGPYDNEQKYDIYRKNVDEEEVQHVAEAPRAYGFNKSYTDEEYPELPDGTYQYGVRTMVDADEVILNEGFENGLPSGWETPWNNASWNVYSSSTYAHNSTYSAYAYSMYKGYTLNITTAVIDLTQNTSAKLSFYYKNTKGTSSANDFYVKIKKETEANWEKQKVTGNTVAIYTKYEMSLDEYVGNRIQLSFEVYTFERAYTYLDDIVITGTKKTESSTVWSNTIKKGGIVFTNNDGAGDGKWETAENWKNGNAPTLNDGTEEVTIKASATISSDVNVKYLAISGGAYLTVNKDATLTVTGELVNNDEYGLTIIDGAQVFHNSENVKARFAMDIVAPETWSSENKDGWQFIAAPFVNNTASIANFTSPNPSTTDYDLYKYNGVNAGEEWDNQKDNQGNWGYYFENGVGYLASYPEERTAYLSGTLNNASSHTWNFTYNNDEQPLANFHLLGNPFSFDMNMNNATFTNMVQGVAIVTAQGGYNYEVTSIPVGDGFFVKATNENPSFSYNAASKATRGEKANSLNVIATSNAGNDNVVINLAGEQEGFPKMRNFNDAIATVYVQDKGANYGIYNCDENTTEVELCFNANQMGNYTISIEPNGKFQTVTLVDRFTGIETNMLLEDYSFTAMSEENNNRFILKLAVSDQQSAVSDNFVYQSGEELIVEAEGTVQIIDVMGRVVYNNDVTSDNNRINVSDFNNGAYVVRVINESEIKVEKVVIY